MAMMEASVASSVASSVLSTHERPPPINPEVLPGLARSCRHATALPSRLRARRTFRSSAGVQAASAVASEAASVYPAPPECEHTTDVPLLFNSTAVPEVRSFCPSAARGLCFCHVGRAAVPCAAARAARMCALTRLATQAPIPNVDELIRDHYDLSGLDEEDLPKKKPAQQGKLPAGRAAWGKGGGGRGRGGGGGGGGAVLERGAEEADVEAMYTPDQRRPSDAEPPEWGAVWGHQPSSGGGGYGYGGRGGPDPEEERRQREEDERARFDRELAVRGHLDDARGGALVGVNTEELDAEEGMVRARIVAVEERIQTILRNPLGEDGLGRKKVWRVRPGNKIWSDTLGDKRASEVLKDGATGVASGATWALRGTAQAVSSGASRVVSWSYKPALWSAAGTDSQKCSLPCLYIEQVY